MKSPIFYTIIAAMLLGGTLPPAALASTSQSVAVPTASAWQKPDSVRKKLAAKIAQALPGLTPNQVSDFIKKPENLSMLLMYRLADAEVGAKDGYARYNENLAKAVSQKQEQIAGLEKEVKSKKGSEKDNAEYRLSCARKDLKVLQREAKYPADLSKCGKVLQAILADNAWMEQIAYSGELHILIKGLSLVFQPFLFHAGGRKERQESSLWLMFHG